MLPQKQPPTAIFRRYYLLEKSRRRLKKRITVLYLAISLYFDVDLRLSKHFVVPRCPGARECWPQQYSVAQLHSNNCGDDSLVISFCRGGLCCRAYLRFIIQSHDIATSKTADWQRPSGTSAMRLSKAN